MFPQSLQRATEIPISKGRTAALALADKFEADIVRQDGTCGKIFGPEHRLQAEYKASGNVVRQALRILEARRIGSMRRGVGGGLELRVPDLAETGQLIALYLNAINADCGDAASAAALLGHQLGERNSSAFAWTRDLLNGVNQALDMSLQSSGAASGNRAMVIARRIIVAARDSVGLVEGARLGSVDELVEAHSSGRPVILQALRILEDLEMVRVQLGRGGGFILRKPTPGAIVRAVFPHFQLNRLPESWLGDLIWTINAINARAVAERFATQAHKRLAAAKRALRPDQFEKGDYSHQLSIWRILADLHGNDVLHVIIRTLFYFQVHSSESTLPPMTAADAQSIHDLTIRLIEAITSGAVDEVAHLMRTYEYASRMMKAS